MFVRFALVETGNLASAAAQAAAAAAARITAARQESQAALSAEAAVSAGEGTQDKLRRLQVEAQEKSDELRAASASLQDEEHVSIRGNQRLALMQKLARSSTSVCALCVCVCVLCGCCCSKQSRTGFRCTHLHAPCDSPFPQSSHTVALLNMIEPDEVDSALEQEVGGECANFGSVERVVVHITSQNTAAIFVQFAQLEGKCGFVL